MSYQIHGTSAIDGRTLVMGEGNTEAEAWEDAVGPKPWTTYQNDLARKFWSTQDIIESGEYQ